jgi:hypothetical protein
MVIGDNPAVREGLVRAMAEVLSGSRCRLLMSQAEPLENVDDLLIALGSVLL